MKNKDNEKVYPYGIMKGITLWKNDNPDDEFSEQNIKLSSNNYDYLVWIFNNDNTLPTMNSIRINKNYGVQLNYNSTASLRWWARRILFVDETTFLAQSCNLINSSGATVDNGKCIPIEVIGYKA